MGNFSRDPKTRLEDSKAKHYVGVRLQQGVPVLDADWNELEDLRRNELESLGAWFIGNGVPSGSDGFCVFPSNNPNDFGIRKGLCMVDGWTAVNDNDVSYSTQPNFGNPDLDDPLPPLTTPGSDKQFIVFLDIWEREVDSEEDPVLVDTRIGVETTVRLKREWAVRVASVPEDLTKLNNPPEGHVYYRLASLNRTANDEKITGGMIRDLRDTQISIQRKVDIKDANGVTVIDNARLLQLMENTRNNVLSFIQYITTQFNPVSTLFTSGEILGVQAADCIARVAESAIGLVNNDNVANRGVLNLLYQLYYAEDRFAGIWKDVVLQIGATPKKYETYKDFIQRLDDRLHEATVGILKGLLPALEAGDVEAAFDMQEEITRLIGSAGSAVPRGAIQVYLAKTPPGNLTNGQTARFEFRVHSFTTLADTYTISILPDAGWPRMVVDQYGNPVPGNRVPIGANGSETTIFVDISVQSGSSDLQLRVVSDSNPNEIDQLTSLYKLNEGAPAPVGEDKVQFHISNVGTATLDPHTGIVSIEKTKTGLVELRLFNNTGQDATFDLTFSKSDELGSWTPEFSGAPTLIVPDGGSLPKTIKVTPGSDAVSLDLTVEATANISGSTVKGQMTISFEAKP